MKIPLGGNWDTKATLLEGKGLGPLTTPIETAGTRSPNKYERKRRERQRERNHLSNVQRVNENWWKNCSSRCWYCPLLYVHRSQSGIHHCSVRLPRFGYSLQPSKLFLCGYSVLALGHIRRIQSTCETSQPVRLGRYNHWHKDSHSCRKDLMAYSLICYFLTHSETTTSHRTHFYVLSEDVEIQHYISYEAYKEQLTLMFSKTGYKAWTFTTAHEIRGVSSAPM